MRGRVLIPGWAPLWFFIVLAVSPCASAEVHIGVQAGANFARLDVAPPDDWLEMSTHSYAVPGAVLDLPLGEHLSLRLEPTLLRTGSESRYSPDLPFELADAAESIRLSYMELPMLLRVSSRRRWARPYLVAGPELGYLLRARVHTTTRDRSVSKNSKDSFKKLDFALALGGGLVVPAGGPSVFVEARGSLGLWGIVQRGGLQRWEARRFLVGAGVTLPVGHVGVETTRPGGEPHPAPERRGFWLRFGMGHGSKAVWCPMPGSCDVGDGHLDAGPKRVGGASGYVAAGGAVSTRLMLGAELLGWSGRQVGGQLDGRIGAFLATVQYYPIVRSGFFLKGGAGVAFYSADLGFLVEPETYRHFAQSAGLGYDIPIGSKVSLTPAIGVMRSSPTRVTTQLGALAPARHNLVDATLAITIH
jgi:hypothetical protein